MSRSKPPIFLRYHSVPTNQLTPPSETILAPVALLLTAASLVLLWFVILSGLTRTTPLRQTYFLRADTSGYEGARAVSQWTYFQVCGNDNTDCGPARPALPLGDAWASNARNVPSSLVGNHGGDTTATYYWYMWRFGWVFFLIALFFEVVAFFSGFLALCSRLGSAFTGLLSTVALFFLTIAVSLMTYVFFPPHHPFLYNWTKLIQSFSASPSSKSATSSSPTAGKLPSAVTASASAGVLGPRCSSLLSSSAPAAISAATRSPQREPLLLLLPLLHPPPAALAAPGPGPAALLVARGTMGAV